jgi:sugar (pentulose or hexulose) kinase
MRWYHPSDVSGLTGLTDDTQVAIAGHDHMCVVLWPSVDREDQILNSTGTTEGLLVVTEAVNNTRRFSVPGCQTACMSGASFPVCLTAFCRVCH